MKKYLPAFLIIFSLIFVISINESFAQSDNPLNPALPDWIKNNFKWYSEGAITEDEILNSIKFLTENNVIRLEPQEPTSQFLHHMRQNPQFMNDWISSMMADEDLRNQMMMNWNQHMMWNPQHMQGWMGPMMDD
ncbi:MAG: hypothetical protein ACO2YR_07225, partial [Nitrosopumilaceae archaeon]